MFEMEYRDRRTTTVRCALGLWVAAAAGAIGCSGGNPYDMVEVAGTVKYEDGSLIPAETIAIRFDPLAAPVGSNTHPRKGFADVNVVDGTFDLATTHKYGDGLVAGKHKVVVIASAKDGKASRVVSEEYGRPDTTPVEIDTSNQPLEIRIKKPRGRA